MILRIEATRYGGFIATPVSDRFKRKAKRHLAAWGIESDGSVFVPNVEDFPLDISKSEARDLDAGWAIRKRIDEWTWGHLVGWDYSN